MPELYRLDLEHFRHRGKALFFTAEGEALYGPSPDNVIYPDGLALTGEFPPITLADVKRAFALGVQVAQKQEVVNDDR